MAQLEFEITGNNSGLSGAVKSSIGLLQSLKQAADSLKVDLFKADTVDKVNQIGNSLQAVTGAMNSYISAATIGSQAFQSQTIQNSLDQLGQKLTTISGNALLFGDSIKSQQSEVNAYQAAITQMLNAGLDPWNAQITNIKSKIDVLNSSINSQKAATEAQAQATKAASAAMTQEQSIVDQLASKLRVVAGTEQLFGQSLKNDQVALSANQAALASLLANGVSPLDSRVQALKTSINTLTASIASQTAPISAEQAALNNLSTSLTVVRGNAELFGKSIQTDQAALNALTSALNTLLAQGISPTDARVQTLKTHIDQTTASLNQQKNSVSSGGSTGFFGGFGSQLNGLVTSYVSLYSAIRVVSAVISSNAEISDSLADVRRTASLTAVETDNLFSSLKKIDTRTSLKGLTDIAVIGGQLNIAKDQLAGFTAAVNTLSVSLAGEIQGGPQEVAKTLGVLDNIFKVSAKNGGDVQRSYNQIGSTLLGLGQTGLATGQFLSDFSNKVGGVAAQAGIAIPVLLSYGAVLQENGITAEVAGTSLNKLIGSLATKRSQFFTIAQIGDASLTLQKFTDLINNDTQGALKAFFDGLNKGGASTTQFRDLLSDIGLDAARSAPGITALARNQERLNELIGKSTQFFKDGTIAAEQAAIKNDTLGASVDKLSKSFVSLTTSGNVSGFFKGIIDGLTQSLNAVNGFINSSSYKELQRNFGNLVSGAIKYSTGGLVNPGQVAAPTAAPTRQDAINKRVQAFTALPTQADQSIAVQAQAERRDLAAQIASGANATRAQITAYNDEQKVLVLLRQTYQALYNDKKKINAPEIADADLKTTKAIRERIKELQNDALANPANKGADIVRIQALNATLKELRGAADGAGSALRGISLSSQLSALLTGSNNSAATSGLKGLALDVQQINDQYDTLNKKLTEFNAKVQASKIPQNQKNNLLAQSAAGQDQGEVNRQKEINDARLKAVQDTANAVQRINDEFGVKATVTRDKEIAQVQALVDQENAKYAEGSQERIAIENGKVAAIQAINDKYAQEQSDLFEKIKIIDDQAKSQGQGKEVSQTAAIAKEWDKRLLDATRYFNELKNLQSGTITGALAGASLFSGAGFSTGLDQKQKDTTADIAKGKNDAVTVASFANQTFNKEFSQGVRQLGSGLTNVLTDTFSKFGDSSTIKNQIKGLQAAQKALVDPKQIEDNQAKIEALRQQLAANSFGNIITDLGTKLQTTLNKTLLSTATKLGTDFLGNALKKGITNGTGNLSDVFKNGISTGVGAGLAAAGVGGLISGLTPKTSAVGQTAGGALSGAGAGFLAGSAFGGPLLGGAIGGVIGGVSGLFGSKKARKEAEALQKQQLEEAQKQTALLRQQALAYTSSIIGKMTTSGVVTGVDINAFGELTATVTGKQLQFVLDRNAKSR